MKIVCLDTDNCNETYYLTDEDYENINLSEKFHKCPYCNKLSILVSNDFFFEKERPLDYYRMYLKLLSKE